MRLRRDAPPPPELGRAGRGLVSGIAWRPMVERGPNPREISGAILVWGCRVEWENWPGRVWPDGTWLWATDGVTAVPVKIDRSELSLGPDWDSGAGNDLHWPDAIAVCGPIPLPPPFEKPHGEG